MILMYRLIDELISEYNGWFYVDAGGPAGTDESSAASTIWTSGTKKSQGTNLWKYKYDRFCIFYFLGTEKEAEGCREECLPDNIRVIGES